MQVRAFRPALLLPLCLPLAAAYAISGGELRFGVEEGTSLTKTYETVLDIEMVSIEVQFNGEDQEAEFPDGFESVEHRTETIRVTDEYERVDDGRVLALVRTYDALAGSEERSTTDPDGTEEMERESASDLQGGAVRFTWDADAEEYEASVADEELDEELLEGLTFDMDCLGLLPGEEVEEGDSWEVEVAAFQHVLSPGGYLHFGWDGEEPDELNREINVLLDDDMSGEITARFAGTREEDGVRVAVIELEGELSAEATSDLPIPDGAPISELVLVIGWGFEFEAELLWNLEAGHAHALGMDAEFEISEGTTQSFDHEGESFEVEQVMGREGELRLEVSWEEAD